MVGLAVRRKLRHQNPYVTLLWLVVGSLTNHFKPHETATYPAAEIAQRCFSIAILVDLFSALNSIFHFIAGYRDKPA
jgi:hypothetical protein